MNQVLIYFLRALPSIAAWVMYVLGQTGVVTPVDITTASAVTVANSWASPIPTVK